MRITIGKRVYYADEVHVSKEHISLTDWKFQKSMLITYKEPLTLEIDTQ